MGSALVHSNIESKINYNYNKSSDEDENYNYKNFKKKIRYENNNKIIKISNIDGTYREFIVSLNQ